jgi:hypothetical protein
MCHHLCYLVIINSDDGDDYNMEEIIILHDSQNMHAYIHMYTRVRTVV